MQETPVQLLGREDPLEKGQATRSSVLAWRIPWTVYIVHGIAKSGTRLSGLHSTPVDRQVRFTWWHLRREARGRVLSRADLPAAGVRLSRESRMRLGRSMCQPDQPRLIMSRGGEGAIEESWARREGRRRNAQSGSQGSSRHS